MSRLLRSFELLIMHKKTKITTGTETNIKAAAMLKFSGSAAALSRSARRLTPALSCIGGGGLC